MVGSGFGGSVAALRLAEKGYRVLVLEAGRRWTEEDFPRTSWDVRNFLWAPALGCYGLQRLTLLPHVLALSGAGVGGGSLVYANTLYEPLPDFFADPQWAAISDWRAELAPWYDQASRMLGVVDNPQHTPSDEAMLAVARRMGVAHTFGPTRVGVLFGERPGEPVADPFFGGVGPTRRTCTGCGSCMTGCRVGAKNTLPKNYLGLAEAAGARVVPLATVDGLRALPGGGWAVQVHHTGRRRVRREVHAEHVVLAAGALGTQRLLQRMVADGRLPGLSLRLGALFRTNSEAILGAVSRRGDTDFTQGVAITSSFHPDEHTHVEPVRYGRGSNVMGLLATVLVDGPAPGEPVRRWSRAARFARQVVRRPGAFARSLSVRRWSQRSVIAVVMQSYDNSLTLTGRRVPGGRVALSSHRPDAGAASPTWIPAGAQVARLLAEEIDGEPMGAWNEVVDIPVTAHVLGGCVIGDSHATGVVDPWHRVYGCPGLHVADASAIPANLGVNPSLTITAMAERAFSHWPNRGEADQRPPVGAVYRRLPPVPPRWPVVPADAPAALRVPAG